MPLFEDVKNFCQKHAIPVKEFQQPTSTAQAAAEAMNCSVAEIAKTILLKIGGSYVVVITAGDVRINSSKIKSAAGLSGKVVFPSADEVQEQTGYEPGGVSPFLLPPHLPIFLDQSLQNLPLVFPAGGNAYSSAIISPTQLADITGGQWVEVAARP